MLNEAPYETAPIPIRDDLAGAHRRVLDRIARPGTWWDAAQRLALAAEARSAPQCKLCRRRKEALSAAAVSGAHKQVSDLPEAAVEVVHRIRTDPGRLTRSWFQGVIDAGLKVEEYVEIVGVVAHTVALDTFARAIGIAGLPLPEPVHGAPSRQRPPGARRGPAWVPWVEPADLSETEAGIYPTGRPPANIHRAMSLVPEEVRSFFDLCEHQYLGPLEMRDFGREFRAITHRQIELLAARVSALNRCFY